MVTDLASGPVSSCEIGKVFGPGSVFEGFAGVVVSCNSFSFVVGPALDLRSLGEVGCRPIPFGSIIALGAGGQGHPTTL